jgi:tetratricopeptide (TPR) repeat protein
MFGSKFLVWIILSRLTGSPVGSAVALLVFWFVVDRFTLGLLPDPLRWLWRLQREWKLQSTLANNPHDGRARLEWANLLYERGANAKCVEVLKPNLARGDDDVNSVFVMGAACVGAGYWQQGETLLEHARELQPGYHVGEIDLVLGRGRLNRGDFAGAKDALERLITTRKGTVEGRVLLARAVAGLGDDGAAALLKDQAWAEYAAAPGFQQRKERKWAWRARPSRPIFYAAVVGLVLFALVQVVGPRLAAPSNPTGADDPYSQGP